MTNEAFLQKLEQADLVATNIVASLRRQITASKEPIANATIAKLLVDKGHLTANQAQRLLAADQAASGIHAAASASSTSVAAKGSATTASAQPAVSAKGAASVHNSSALDDLGLAPLDDLAPAAETKAVASASSIVQKETSKPAPAKPSPPTPAVIPLALDDLGLAPLDDAAPPPASTTKQPPAAGSSTASKPATSKPTPSKPAVASKPAVNKPAVNPPASKASVPTASTGLEQLTPLDDLGTGGLEALDDFGPSPAADPFGAVDPFGAADPFGAVDPFGAADPFGAPADLGALAAPLASAPAAQPAANKAKTEAKTTWIVGLTMGGVALVVVIVGLVIVLWPRGDGQIEFQAAEQAYQERQYATAIEKYDVLLRAFPRHEQASLARVHRGLAVIHTAHGSAGENSQLLAKLQQEAPALAGEPAIGQAHNELVPLLLKLTEDLTTTAASSKAGQASKEQLQAARAALALCNDARLLPANLRPWQKLAEYEERLQLRERELDRQAAIAAAQKAMNEQLQTGDVSAALAARRQALQQFADAASAIDSPELTASLLAAARSSVKPEPLSQSPATEPPTSAVVASYPWHSLASPSAADSAPSAVIPVLAAETVYGLDAVSGRVVWSRYLGGASALSSLVASDGQTACLLDVSKQELLRVGLLDGAVRWRQRLPAKPVGLVQVNQGIVVALDSGMLLRFAIADGEGSAQVQLPQSLSRPPLRLNDKRLVQWADEALVYVLDAETLACEQVIAVGHELGMLMHGVAVPRAKDVQLLAALRLPNQKTRLVLTGMLAEAAESHSLTLDGQPADSPLLLGNRVLLPWLSGEVLAFSLDDEKPLQNKAAVAIPPTVKQVHAWQTQAGAVYALGVGLSRLNHDGPSAMTTEWSALADHSVASLFGLSEKLVIATYFDASRQAWLAAALEPASGQVQWTTSLSPSMQLVAAEGANPHVLPLPFAAGTSLLLKLDSNRYVLGAIGHDQLVVQGSGPAATGNEALTIQLPAPLAGQPALVGKLLLVPLVTGEVLGIDANTYQTQTLAIRVASPASDRPLAIAAYPGPQAESEVLLCTSESVVLWKQGLAPQSTWTEETTVRWSEPLVSAPVVTNAAVVGFAPSGKVLTLTLPDLTPGVATDLAGAQVAAGPWIVGDSILLTTTAGELVSLSPAGERQWQQSLATGSLAGSPSAAGEKLVIAGKAGVIELRAAATGELVQSLDAGQPLLGSPLALGKQLWVPAMSGQILQLGSPTEGAQP